MALSTYVRTIVHGIGADVDERQTLAGVTGGIEVSETITDATDQLLSVAFVLAKLKVFIMVSSTAMTVKTNDSGSPQETLTLAAGVPFVYVPGAGLASPFDDDVTALYVTNTGASQVQVRVGVDAT